MKREAITGYARSKSPRHGEYKEYNAIIREDKDSIFSLHIAVKDFDCMSDKELEFLISSFLKHNDIHFNRLDVINKDILLKFTEEYKWYIDKGPEFYTLIIYTSIFKVLFDEVITSNSAREPLPDDDIF